MYGDFSRDSSTAIRNRRVFMQQGRVLLDADYNDQVASLLHTLETLTADLIGPHGGPKESFRVYEDCGSLKAKAGHYFVKGLLCETTDEKPTPIETPKEEGYHVVYLEAYERHITSAEDPSWREPALRGAETAARTRVEHLFRAKKLNDKDEFDKFVKLLRYRRYERRPIEPEAPPRSGCSPLGWIAAAVLELVKFKSVPVLISPEERARREEEFNKAFLAKCAPPRLSGACPLETCYVNADGLQPDVYRGFANRLYRIEIHDADEGKPATFKWSRDNGAVTFEAVKDQSLTAKANESAVLQIHDPLKESGQRLQTGQWVELFDRAARRGAGQLMRVQSVRPPDQQGNAELTLEVTEAMTKVEPLFVRLWDHGRSLALEANKNTNQNQPVEPLFGAVPISRAIEHWFELEDGLQIKFTDPASIYQTGDSWLITVRAQGKLPSPIAPICTKHAYAPLALIEVTAGGKVRVHADCRRIIRPTALMQ